MKFEQAFELLLGHEGGFVDNPDDPGGATRWGITAAVARAHGYQGPMQDLPVAVARGIAKIAYWDAVKADQLPEAVRYAVFDAAYHSGPGQAVRWLQRALGVPADGILGQQTLGAANVALPDALLRKLLGQRLEFLTDLPTWKTFGRGWARRLAALMAM